MKCAGSLSINASEEKGTRDTEDAANGCAKTNKVLLEKDDLLFYR